MACTEAIMCFPQIVTYAIVKKRMGTQGRHHDARSVAALVGKKARQDETPSISKEIKSVASVILELCLSEGNGRRKSVKSIILKFHNYLIEGFRIDLKMILGLAVPNQYCISVHLCIKKYVLVLYAWEFVYKECLRSTSCTVYI